MVDGLVLTLLQGEPHYGGRVGTGTPMIIRSDVMPDLLYRI